MFNLIKSYPLQIFLERFFINFWRLHIIYALFIFKKITKEKLIKRQNFNNIKNNRKLTDEEIRDYELELGDSETWLNKGTFGEAEQALKNQKAYEAKMFAEYKSIGGSRRPGGPKERSSCRTQRSSEEPHG